MVLSFFLGSLVGATLGLFGGGGSTLAIPLLAYGLGLDPRQAIATSLMVVGLAALAGAWRHWQRRTLDFPAAVLFGIFGAIGSAVGAQAARFVPPPAQMIFFAVVMIGAAILMLTGGGQPDCAPAARPPVGLLAIGAALGVGLLTGIVGIGGGFLIVPALVLIVGLPIHRAIGTSLVIIAANAAGGIASYLSYVMLTPSVWAPFAAGAVLASIAASGLGSRFSEDRLRRAFAVGLVLLGFLTIGMELFVVR